MPELFISYRRADAQGHAGRLYDRLCEAFGAAALFYDQESISAGERWSQAIDDHLHAAQVVLAIIAPGWVDAEDPPGMRRLDKADDVVRRELAIALQSGKTVIPVLIDDTPIPRPEKLPPDLQALAGALQIHTLRSAPQHLYEAGVAKLIDWLRPKLRPPCAPVVAINPEQLPYLCDRSPQEEYLRDFFETQSAHPNRFRRPIVCLVPGAEGEAHDAFLERLRKRFLPRQLESLGWVGGGADEAVKFYCLNHRPQARDAAGFAREFRRRLWEELQIRAPCQGDDHLWRVFQDSRARLVAPVLTLSSREAFGGAQTYFEMLAEYWRQFPALPEGLLVVSFVSLTFLADGSAASLNAALQARIDAFAAQADPAAPVLCTVIPELKPIAVEDVRRWSQDKEVTGHLRGRLSDKRLHELFGSKSELPMEDVISLLIDYLSIRRS